ncbi:alpha-amylase family glycosyl hydrolase [Thalassotalea agarivorans]|uniref:Alpha-amylase n=1 Tax=Thalassotalea agarivorans TaxID=349064 RepID=A0A1I0BUX0_THASX|nr:alpha-amylase family glycosyl hydrolase [Thalassotalea agarivorans]SET10862.1 Glycosidase [Thalassotalea agarivorans]
MTIKQKFKQLSLAALSISLFACSEQAAEVEQTVEQAAPTASVLAKDLAPYSERGIEQEVFYFVMPDRFDNGDTDNDMGSKTIALSRGGFEPENPKAFHGGDMQGLINNLDYLENMGITAIWLTPILRNQAQQGEISGYHGYWVLDFTEIDPHLGTNDDLKAFIDAAHAKNMKVYFDIITNHTADVIKFTECHGEDGSGWSQGGQECPYISLAEMAEGKKYTAIVPEGSLTAKTPAWLNDPKYYHNQGDTFWEGESSLNGDFAGLDDLYTEMPEVVEGMTDIYKNIITQFKPDGFRIDTVKHVNIEFWQQFIPALEAHAKAEGINNFFMFGEVYDPEPAALARFTTEGTLPSVLDFGLQSVIYQTLVENKGTEAFKVLFDQDHLYKNADQLLTFTGNHDMGRFAYLLNKDKQQYDEAAVISRINLGHAMIYFMRGVPVVYYGDEQGFVGDGNDIMSRQDMMPSKVPSYNDDDLIATDKTTADNNFDPTHPFYIELKLYADLYQQYEALRSGKQDVVFTEASAGLVAVTRTAGSEKVLAVFNTATEAKTLSYNVSGGEVIYPSNATITEESVTVAPLSFVLIKL